MSEFQSRLLYTQKSSAILNEQEPVTVSSTIYGIRFLYPGASQHTTSRIRITCTYRDTDQFESHSGVIERWTDKGWILLDDYTDDVLAFDNEKEFRKRLLDYSHAFIMGIPLATIDSSYVPDSISYESKSVKTKRSFSIDSKKQLLKKDDQNIELKDNYKKTENNKTDDDSDDDDLDWL
jgi:hypothetical protein